MILAQITAGHFCAGLFLDRDTVTTAAPIIGYMAEQRWTRDQVRAYCRERGWSIRVVQQWPDVSGGDGGAADARASSPSS